MLSILEILDPDFYRTPGETSDVIIIACLVGFFVSLGISLLSFRSAIKQDSGSFLWCGIYALAYSLWNLFFLFSYTNRGLELFDTSLSADFSDRAYLGIGVLLPSFAHACLRRIYHARFLVSNRMHFFGILLAIAAFSLPAGVYFIYFRWISGVFAFGAFYWITQKVWNRYKRSKDLRLKTRSLFLGVGLSSCLALSFLGQLRAESIIPLPIPYLGNIVTVVFLYFIYQMIANPRLREIRELMLRGIRVILLTGLLSIIFLVLLAWVGENDPELFLFNTFLASFIIISVLEPIRKRVDKFIIKKLISDRYEFEKLIHSISRKIRRSRSIEDLVGTIVNGLRESDRIYRTGIYLLDPATSQFRLVGKSNLNTPPVLAYDHDLPSFFRENPVKYVQEGGGSLDLQRILKEMRAHLIFSIWQSKSLAGLWIIRSSLSEKNPYTSFSNSEIKLLERLVNEASGAMEQLRHFEKQDQQQRLAALGEMSAALAHEIRNPLGAIQGATELLDTSPTLANEEDRECVSIMKSEIDRLQQTVNQYLHYARKPEQDRILKLEDIIQKAIDAARPKAEKMGAQVTFEAPKAGYEVQTDPLKLEQVLINLITNAAEAFSKNIFVEIEPVSVKGESLIDIHVRDDGPGIPSEVLPNIFTPLFTTKRAGSGLGLPICKKIIDSLGGDLRVKSRQEEGTTFSVRLKLEDRAHESSEAS